MIHDHIFTEKPKNTNLMFKSKYHFLIDKICISLNLFICLHDHMRKMINLSIILVILYHSESKNKIIIRYKIINEFSFFQYFISLFNEF